MMSMVVRCSKGYLTSLWWTVGLSFLSPPFAVWAEVATTTTCVAGSTSPECIDAAAAAEASTCSIYMAPASMKGNPGNGIYTTRDVRKGETFLQAPDIPSIPILDYDESWTPDETEAKARRHFYQSFQLYWWTSGKPDHVAYMAAQTADFQLTFGSLPNHHCLLQSLESAYPANSYADRRSIHSPSAGAYSYNRGRVFFASRDVAAGEEIYLDYGHCERDVENPSEWYDFVPMPDDYDHAARIFRNDFIPSLERGEFPVLEGNVSEIVSRLLPTSLEQVQFIQQTYGLDDTDQLVRALAMHTAAERRTPEWIRTNGVCVEHLVPGPSTIPFAAQGAIAQHALSAGEIVVPAPMLQVLDRDALRMYDSEGDLQVEQLLVNYCLGHNQSSMLLCPMTNAALINHDSKNPNAVFKWHDSSMEHFNKTVDEFWEGNGRGLRMDVVALRDIEIGEEVLVDYGSEWEQAWKEHITSWVGPFRFSTEELNAQTDIPDHFLSYDMRKVADDPFILTGCQYHVTNDENHEYYRQKNERWRDLNDDELIRRYADLEDGFSSQEYEHHRDSSHWPCTIIRLEHDDNYLVRIHQHPQKTKTPWTQSGVPRFLMNFPRSSIHFFPRPYGSDQSLNGAFRQPIGIPDGLFPLAWRNRRPADAVLTSPPADQ